MKNLIYHLAPWLILLVSTSVDARRLYIESPKKVVAIIDDAIDPNASEHDDKTNYKIHVVDQFLVTQQGPNHPTAVSVRSSEIAIELGSPAKLPTKGQLLVRMVKLTTDLATDANVLFSYKPAAEVRHRSDRDVLDVILNFKPDDPNVPAMTVTLKPDDGATIPANYRVVRSRRVTSGWEIQIQLDSGDLVWRPGQTDIGLREVTVALSTAGEETVRRTVRVDVQPPPRLELEELMIEPGADLDGDGRIDRYGDQYIELVNRGDRPVNLTGWLLGDDDATTKVDSGVSAAPGHPLVIFGSSLGAPGAIGDGLEPGDRVLLIWSDGPDTLLAVRVPRGEKGTSLVRSPSDSARWIPHTALSPEPYSIGPQTAARDTTISTPGFNGWPRDGPHVMVRPNPFNSAAQIMFSADRGPVVLRIFTAAGQVVREEALGRIRPGVHTLSWNGVDQRGRSVATGIYILSLQTPGWTASTRAAFIR